VPALPDGRVRHPTSPREATASTTRVSLAAMSFFTNLRAERLIADIKAAGDADDQAPASRSKKLGRLGPSAIPRIIDALANADKNETAGFVGVLAGLLDNKTLPTGGAGLKRRQPALGRGHHLGRCRARAATARRLLLGMLEPTSPCPRHRW